MKAPVLLNPIDIDGARNGDFDAIADCLKKIYDAHNAQALSLAARIGNWKKVPYDATDFTSSVGAWTVSAGSVLELESLVIDDVLFLHGSLQNTTLSADSTDLFIKLPGGYLLQEGSDARGHLGYNQGAVTAGNVGHAFVNTATSRTKVGFERQTGADWEAASPRIDLFFAIWLHIALPAGG